MDDFLYFLLLIGWLAFSFYQQSAKKKKQQEAQRKAAARQNELDDVQVPSGQQQQTVQQEAAKPDFKKTLEEILLGGELNSLEEIPEQEARSLETIPSQKESKNNQYQEFYDQEMSKDSIWYDKETESPEKLEEKIEELEKEMVLQEDDTIDDESYAVGAERKQWFDLRKAVIYAEILNAKYVN